jgi:chromosome segregation ATPase
MSETLLKQIVNKLDDMQTEHQRYSDLIHQLITNVGYLGKQIGGLDLRMDGLEQRMDGLVQRMDGLDQRMDGLDQRMERLESKVDDISLEMNSLQEGQERQNRILESLSMRSLEQETQIREIKRF